MLKRDFFSPEDFKLKRVKKQKIFIRTFLFTFLRVKIRVSVSVKVGLELMKNN